MIEAPNLKTAPISWIKQKAITALSSFLGLHHIGITFFDSLKKEGPDIIMLSFFKHEKDARKVSDWIDSQRNKIGTDEKPHGTV